MIGGGGLAHALHTQIRVLDFFGDPIQTRKKVWYIIWTGPDAFFFALCFYVGVPPCNQYKTLIKGPVCIYRGKPMPFVWGTPIDIYIKLLFSIRVWYRLR